jgi:hypothetical protein
MSYALVKNNVIQSEGGLPRSARRLDTQEWVMGLAAAGVTLQRACGYYEVVDTPRPADTATTTWDRSLVLETIRPTVRWTERPYTQQELDNRASSINAADLHARLLQARQINKAHIDRGVTNTGAQVRDWTVVAAKQLNGIIAYLLGELGDVSDTV